MRLLTLRTDKPEAEIGLYDDDRKLAYETWLAHRQLAETLHRKIADMLSSQQLSLHDLNGIVVFQGPGSFTGLRIGLSVANALAYALAIPVIACQGEDWLKDGVARLVAGADDRLALPEYGALPNISRQKK